MSREKVRAKLALSDGLMVGVTFTVGYLTVKGTREPFTPLDALATGLVFAACVLVLVSEAKRWAHIVAAMSAIILSYLFFR